VLVWYDAILYTQMFILLQCFVLDGLQSKVVEALLDIKIPSIRQQVKDVIMTLCTV